MSNTKLLTNLIMELTCSICSELSVQPVRLKVDEGSKQSICNDVFCEPCVIKMFYHYQNSANMNANNVKCPMCSQKISLENIDTVFDCYVEDKISRKIIYQILQETPKLIEYNCKYNCGFIGNNIKGIEDHYKAEANRCNSRIVKCSVKVCPILCKVGKGLYDHEKCCPFKYISCPLCTNNVENDKNIFLNHMVNYHKLKNIKSILNITEQISLSE